MKFLRSLEKLNVGSFLSNQFVFGGLALVLILYGSYSKQTLPSFVYKALDNRFVTFIIFMIIALLGTQDAKSAFVVALLFAVIMHNLNNKKITEGFMDALKNEGFDPNIDEGFENEDEGFENDDNEGFENDDDNEGFENEGDDNEGFENEDDDDDEGFENEDENEGFENEDEN